MSVFSGVRIVGILCSLVRNKLIAWFIGPAGLGLVMLFNSVVDLIGQSTRLSIDQSAQRDISNSSEANSEITISVVRKWSLWLGLTGFLVTCLLSPVLSIWTFETVSHWPTFCLLAIVPLCLTYGTCINAENQGLKRFKAVAVSNLLCSLGGLVGAVPLILWLGIDSIVWVIVIYGIASWFGSWLMRPRIRKIELPRNEIIQRGKSFVKLGAQITIAQFVTQAFAYIFVLFLNTYASTGILGIYQSGYTLMNSYVGIVFSALWVEYYPRLAAMSHSPRRMAFAASHEARLALLILTPLLCLFIVLANPLVRLIYSSDFLSVIPYLVLAAIGVIFRITSFSLAFIILARGDGKAYLTTEILSVLVGFGLNMAGYFLGGFAGLGIAYTLWYAIYTAIVAIMCRVRYGITFNRRTWLLTAAMFFIVSAVAVIYLIIT